MKKEHTEFYEKVVDNLRKIMVDRHITQVAMGDYMDTSESGVSKIFGGTMTLTIDHLANLASRLSMSVTDILEYGRENKAEDPVEAVLQIKPKKDKKDQVLKLVFGDNNIEILNR